MSALRSNVRIVGFLFVLGTATGVAGKIISSPILAGPDFLAQIAANQGQIVLTAFLYFAMAVSCAGIGLALYPILKPCSEGLAIGVAGFRTIEGVTQVAAATGLVSLLALSRDYVQTNAAAEGAVYQTMGSVIQESSNWLGNGPMLTSWCIAALMYYSVFYRFNLVPRWLSVWGLAGITLAILVSLVSMLNLFPLSETLNTALNMPIAIQEMVFAVWLIARGIRPADIPRPAVISSEPLTKGAGL
ncbi:MAG TPA: DUF4386 domain-containing protein [Anaerolineaceae bacterium]|nr:DUF4386 domain-containing protein [Anaerolineaceae bacterium]